MPRKLGRRLIRELLSAPCTDSPIMINLLVHAHHDSLLCIKNIKKYENKLFKFNNLSLQSLSRPQLSLSLFCRSLHPVQIFKYAHYLRLIHGSTILNDIWIRLLGGGDLYGISFLLVKKELSCVMMLANLNCIILLQRVQKNFVNCWLYCTRELFVFFFLFCSIIGLPKSGMQFLSRFKTTEFISYRTWTRPIENSRLRNLITLQISFILMIKTNATDL